MRVPLVWGVLGFACSGVVKLVDRFLYTSWYVDAPVQCDATVDTPSPILCGVIFSWSAYMRCIASYFIFNSIPKSLTTRVNIFPFLLWHHNPGVIGDGSYLNGR